MNKVGKLVMLVVNNLRAIEVKEVELDEAGQFVRLTGDNGTGKSTFLEAIEVLFNGGKLPDGVIRNGQKEATIEGRFSGGHIARRRIRKNKGGKQVAELVVTDPNGEVVPAAGAFLKDLFSGFITPAKMANSEGAALYKRVVALIGVDIEKLEAGIATLKAKASEARGALNAIGETSQPELPRPTGAAFNSERYMDLYQISAASVNAKNTQSTLDFRHSQMAHEIESLQKLMVDNRTERAEADRAIRAGVETEKEFAALCVAKQSSETSADLIKAWDRYDEWNESAGKAGKAYDAAVAEVKAGEESLRKTLSEATGPGNVRVTEDRKVLLGDAAWELAAFSERMLAATMMQLASKEEGKLPLVFIEHGESLNTDKQRAIAKAAIDQGATVFIEVMDEDVNELVISTEAAVDVEWAEEVTLVKPADPQPEGLVPVKEETVPELVLTQEQGGKISPPPPPSSPVPGPPPSAVDDFDIF